MQKEITTQITQIALRLTRLAEQGYSLQAVAELWASIPEGDTEGLTYLEAAAQCVLTASDIVNKTCPDLPANQKTAKKYSLMADLLQLKAEQLNRLG